MNPTDPPSDSEMWAELHVDDHVFRLVKPWNLDQLATELETAACQDRRVKVKAYTEFNGVTTVLLNPARATVIYLAKRPRVVSRNGMPDVSLRGLP